MTISVFTHKRWIATAAVLLSCEIPFATAANAQVPVFENIPIRAPMNQNLREQVLSKLQSTNQMEVTIGQIALQRSQNAEVRMLAQGIVRDHMSGERELMAFSSRERTPLHPFVPETASEILDQRQDQITLARLMDTRLQGQAFDLAFLDANIMGHASVYNWLVARVSLLDPVSEKFVRMQMAVIQNHYQMSVRVKQMLAD